jgi:hypothetical protein
MIFSRNEDSDKFTKEKMVKAFYDQNRMPCCGGLSFKEGPHGGLAVNIQCENCGEWFNICPPMKFIEKIGPK